LRLGLTDVKIPDFLDFHDRLERSLQRDLAKVELMRMRLAHEPITSDFIDMELIELKFNFDRCDHIPCPYPVIGIDEQ
jgi:N-terminal acetyltransferase B complex non-catalytic subunit